MAICNAVNRTRLYNNSAAHDLSFFLSLEISFQEKMEIWGWSNCKLFFRKWLCLRSSLFSIWGAFIISLKAVETNFMAKLSIICALDQVTSEVVERKKHRIAHENPQKIPEKCVCFRQTFYTFWAIFSNISQKSWQAKEGHRRFSPLWAH